MQDLYLGLISGTSMDGIDTVLASFNDRSVELHAARSHDYPDELRRRLRAAMLQPERCGLDESGELDTWVGESFRDAALTLLASCGVAADRVRAIGSHGQTLRHRPTAEHRFSLQIGDPATIATGTGITTVADFRSNDMALGGEGAPLVPPFHEWLFRDPDENRVVLNIGGIANITILPAGGGTTRGFDTGPGNTLLDAWSRRIREIPFDDEGQWAASGKVNQQLLVHCLDDPWIGKEPPKSTGFEYFNLDWLQRFPVHELDAADVQATLAALTATSIADAIRRWSPGTRSVHVCGGGARNLDLLRRIAEYLPNCEVQSTGESGLPADWVEAAAFAWLAMRRIHEQPGNLPAVTGASRSAILGAIYPA